MLQQFGNNTLVCFRIQKTETVIPLGKFTQDSFAPVRGTIVYAKDFKFTKRLTGQALKCPGQKPFTVIDGNDHTDLRCIHSSAIARSKGEQSSLERLDDEQRHFL